MRHIASTRKYIFYFHKNNENTEHLHSSSFFEVNKMDTLRKRLKRTGNFIKIPEKPLRKIYESEDNKLFCLEI